MSRKAGKAKRVRRQALHFVDYQIPTIMTRSSEVVRVPLFRLGNGKIEIQVGVFRV